MKLYAVSAADRELAAIVRPKALPLASPPHCTPRADESLTPEQIANVASKQRFATRVLAVLGELDSSGVLRPPPVRDLALFFGVKRTKLHERMRLKRTDLAPLDEWFAKLDRYEDFLRSADEFLRTA